MDQKYIDAVKDKNLIRVRLSITNELMLDPRGISFREMLKYAEAALQADLYQEDDGLTYAEDSSSWNEDFLYKVKNDVDLTFSKNKLAFYERVARYVLRDKASRLDAEAEKVRSDCPRQPLEKAQKAKTSSKKQLYAGITIGGAAVAVTGLCISRMAVTSLGLAGAIIGGILLLNDTKK